MSERPTWDGVWMAVALDVAKRSLCTRSQVGAVVIDPHNRIGAVGYNGPPRGLDVSGPCSNWCLRNVTGGAPASYDDCYSSHAEMNCLLQANARDIEGGTLYVTRMPCFTCAKVISNSGVVRVVYRADEVDNDREPDRSKDMMWSSGLTVEMW